MTELIETGFDIALVQITLNLKLVSNFVNPGTCEPNSEVNIEDPMLLTDSNRYTFIDNIYKIVRVPNKIKINELILDNVASLITWPLFCRDDHIISFKGLNQ